MNDCTKGIDIVSDAVVFTLDRILLGFVYKTHPKAQFFCVAD